MSQNKKSHIHDNSSPLQEKFINCMMIDGKKSISRRIFNNALTYISEKTQKDPSEVFHKAVENVKPSLEVKAKRIGGAVYQIPMEVKPARKTALSIRWLLGVSQGKKGSPMYKKLADELILAANGEGAAIKKRDDVLKMAQANKAFAHYAKY